jgi:GNAT superfamily N-acetyltransferase
MVTVLESDSMGMSSPTHYSTNAEVAVPANNPADITIVDSIEGEMIQAVSRLHLEAFNEYLNARLGVGYASALIGWFAREKEAIAIAAIDRDHRVVGYAIGAPSNLVRVQRQDMFWVTARSIILRPWLLFDLRLWKVGEIRLRHIFAPRDVRPVPDLPEPTMSLVGIGVALSHRKTGVGLRLLQAFEEKARALKMRSLSLWVLEDKMANLRFYEKCGWRLCPDALGEKGVSQYVRLLDHQGIRT